MKNNNITVFHAATRRNGRTFLTAGGRVLGVTGIGENLNVALKRAYEGVQRIRFKGATYRSDIGRRPKPKPVAVNQDG
ncbi:MAG: hypothetical protein D6800_01390 [Candidatus Zixiibacteriota bacterium]|nr:MAG: hypothetical protein D6800_01390 [candidate division Zixibacteria bacterium]